MALGDCIGKYVSSRLLDIRGVISEEGWEPDWPIILEFESGVVSMNTKCSRDWAIDPWEGYHFSSNEEWPLSCTSLHALPQVARVYGKTLDAVFWPANRTHGMEQCFLLLFGNQMLKIFDAGDQLGLAVFESSQPLDGLERIPATNK